MNTNAFDIINQDYQNVLANKSNVFAPLKNSLVVITGATGFMGTWITGMLCYLNEHHNFNTEIVLVSRNTDKVQFKNKYIKSIASDVRNLFDLPAQTSWIIHCAASPDNRIHASNPLETMNIISQGTHAVLRAAERCSHLKMMLNVSSGLVYGPQPLNQEILSETFAGAPKCNTVSSAYAEAKRYAETLCHSARSQARIPVVTARPFAFIGPYQGLNTPWALNNFIYDALKGNPIRVFSDGETVRSYLYGSDMAYWLLKILTYSSSGEIYNVGSSEAVTLKSLATMIAEEISPKAEIQLRTSSGVHSQLSRFVPDISLAKNNMQLTVTVPLHEALKRTIIWNKLQCL